jgi:hypothetical protein
VMGDGGMHGVCGHSAPCDFSDGAVLLRNVSSTDTTMDASIVSRKRMNIGMGLKYSVDVDVWVATTSLIAAAVVCLLGRNKASQPGEAVGG